ncbi:MAG: TlyA family rRNA (cytidine-2'-O)-methyltransferase, partial [Spirochaetota bacterium]
MSFISLTAILPAVAAQLAEDGEIVALVKPQFEVDKADAPGGVVRDEAARQGAARRVREAAAA